MDVGKYRAVTKPLALDFEGEIINLTYRPNALSLADARQVEVDLTNEDRAADLLKLVASWDLEYAPGEPVPLTVEALIGLPVNILLAIDIGLADALIPSEEEKRGSSVPTESLPQDSTSTSSASHATSENGSTTSASPTASESVPTS